MTYCLALRVNQGLVFASDSRTSSSVDDVRTYGKMQVYTPPNGALFVLLSAGNLATTQAVNTWLARDITENAEQNLGCFRHMFDAAEYVGRINMRCQKAISNERGTEVAGLEATFIFGGQIPGEEPTLYLIYSVGNCITISPEMPFLQIGENKYGKPILDRIIRPELPIEDAARCALVSLDSTMRSNVSVAPPIDLLIYRQDEFAVKTKLRFDYDTDYYRELRAVWGRELEAIFTRLPRFEWEAAGSGASSAAPTFAWTERPRRTSDPEAKAQAQQ